MNRREVITSLVEFASALDVLKQRLAALDWDSDEQVPCLPRHVRHVLERHLEGEIGVPEVEVWANLIEGRDDIELPASLREVIFELANPSITRKLSSERARELIGGLEE